MYVPLLLVAAHTDADTLTSKDEYFFVVDQFREHKDKKIKVPDFLHCSVNHIDVRCFVVCSYSMVRFKMNGLLKN